MDRNIVLPTRGFELEGLRTVDIPRIPKIDQAPVKTHRGLSRVTDSAQFYS